MKKILAFFSALAIGATTGLSVSACGVSKGEEIKIKVNAPKEDKEGKNDPLSEYVYNNKYNYINNYSTLLIAIAAQLATDKIYDDNQKTLNSEIWKEFYSSQEWQRGYFSSFNYDQSAYLPAAEHDFSFKANNNQDLIYQVRSNDASKDDNKLRIYWFVTSEQPWSNDSKDYKPTKNNITIPNISDFDNEKKITKTGWIHLYLLIGNFRIDFSAEINFTFNKFVDGANIPVVLLDITTFSKPFGEINFNNKAETYNKVLRNLTVSKTE